MIDTANSPFLPHRPPGMPCLTACDLKKELPNFSSSDSLLMSSTFPGQLPLASRLKWKGRLFLSAKVQNVSRLKTFQSKIIQNYMGLQKQSIFWQFINVWEVGVHRKPNKNIDNKMRDRNIECFCFSHIVKLLSVCVCLCRRVSMCYAALAGQQVPLLADHP